MNNIQFNDLQINHKIYKKHFSKNDNLCVDYINHGVTNGKFIICTDDSCIHYIHPNNQTYSWNYGLWIYFLSIKKDFFVFFKTSLTSLTTLTLTPQGNFS